MDSPSRQWAFDERIESARLVLTYYESTKYSVTIAYFDCDTA